MTRIAVTGLGAVSAAGLGADRLWDGARDGVAQISALTLDRGENLHIKIAGVVQDFDPAAHIPAPALRRCDRFTQFTHVAVSEALREADIGDDVLAGARTAVIIGTGIGGMTTIEDGVVDYYGGRRANVLAIPRLMPSSAAAHVSITHHVTGPCFAVSSACSSASQAIGLGRQLIGAGIVDRAIVGGTEACLTPATVRAWEVLKVLSPDTCRPFAADRNGLILGEGAGILVLESEAAMLERGARPIVWLAGYGTSSDARDIIQPDIDGAVAAIQAALADAALPPSAIDYINAHGTGTVLNDLNEAAAVNRVFGDLTRDVPVSSTKPIIGHTLGASGALEVIVTIKALLHGIVPPHINMTTQDERCGLFLPGEALERPVRAALSNSFAFGGINACLVVTTAAAV